MTNEQLIAENIKVKIQIAEKRFSRLEAWGEMERKEEPENYALTVVEMDNLVGYITALKELLEFPQLRIFK